jgi:DNA end-binding protein Ku
MAARANRKGFLKLSLVSCNIALVQAAPSDDKIRCNIVNGETGSRVRLRQVDAETGEEVPEQERIKGYKAADGSDVPLEPGELDAVAPESTHTIGIEFFAS